MQGVKFVEFEDWMNLDLRVAQIKNVEAIEGADKLWKLSLDVGEIGERVICAGLKEFYSKEELINKKIIYFSNLKPRKMRGVESQGMLLAASVSLQSSPQPPTFEKEKNNKEDLEKINIKKEKVVLITPEKDIENGARIG